jgi:hypothetical protein
MAPWRRALAANGLAESNRTSCALLARYCSENEALIVDLLDWKKF